MGEWEGESITITDTLTHTHTHTDTHTDTHSLTHTQTHTHTHTHTHPPTHTHHHHHHTHARTPTHAHYLSTRPTLTGSAGGIGAIFNVDYVANRFPRSTVKGAPNAGWFFPGDPLSPPTVRYANASCCTLRPRTTPSHRK